ncbi:pyrroloquinoline quinone biosynthesis peptide chaperone PqqD [Acidocella sp.]|uniref:pyrroloquinoline quinone biosynthesis peptide chaperone PqqD n=1 Tax=Acidocella sp. TaxID=50710 RepID=UPI002F42CAD5
MTLTRTSVPALKRGVRRHFDKARNTQVLMAPERVIMLDDVGDAIVSECDAVSSVEEITLRLSARFATPAENIEGDVLAFLQELLDKGLIQS